MATLEEQIEILSVLIDPIMQALGACSEAAEVTADDLLDLFALATATVIENDRHLKTDAELSLGVATAAQRIDGHVRALRIEHELTGVSKFTQLLEAARSEGTASPSLN
ncbi:hypothetical protein ACFB49_27270 [Sphingomonas sp. DBB INV C78]|uniref:hypothetical protein n=1 Tax=Sphingomonas sp. DBB INV C78 TaxID=3349434 RepID=UPI0036D2646F